MKIEFIGFERRNLFFTSETLGHCYIHIMIFFASVIASVFYFQEQWAFVE